MDAKLFEHQTQPLLATSNVGTRRDYPSRPARERRSPAPAGALETVIPPRQPNLVLRHRGARISALRAARMAQKQRQVERREERS